MHKSLNWLLLVKDRLLYSQLIFIRNVSATKTLHTLYQNLSFSTDKHNYSTRHTTAGNFIVPKVKTNAIKRTVTYRATLVWNLLPRSKTQENRLFKLKLALKERFLLKSESHLCTLLALLWIPAAEGYCLWYETCKFVHRKMHVKVLWKTERTCWSFKCVLATNGWTKQLQSVHLSCILPSNKDFCLLHLNGHSSWKMYPWNVKMHPLYEIMSNLPGR